MICMWKTRGLLMILIYHNTKGVGLFVLYLYLEYWGFFDDLYLLQYYRILMICICNIKDFWWFVFTTLLKGFDDLYSREDNQCNMFLYQEEKTHLASHQNLSGATPLNINMIRTLWKLTITKKWKDKSTFQTSIKSGSMWKFVS